MGHFSTAWDACTTEMGAAAWKTDNFLNGSWRLSEFSTQNMINEDQHPAAFKKLSYGDDAGSIKDRDWGWTVAGAGTFEFVVWFWSIEGFPTCCF